MRPVRGTKNTKKKKKRHPDCVILYVRPDHPSCGIEPKFGMRVGTPDIVHVFGFQQNQLRGFGAAIFKVKTKAYTTDSIVMLLLNIV